MNPRLTTILIAAVSIIVALTITPWALIGIVLAAAYWFIYGRQSDV